MQYISEKAQKVVEKIDEIDAMINEHTTGWKTGRMNKVDLTILRLAVYEMKWDEDVPDRCCNQRSCQSCEEIQQ